MAAPSKVRLRKDWNLARLWVLEAKGYTYLAGKRRSRKKVDKHYVFADTAGTNNGTQQLHEAVKAVTAKGLRHRIKADSHIPRFVWKKDRPFRPDEQIPYLPFKRRP